MDESEVEVDCLTRKREPGDDTNQGGSGYSNLLHFPSIPQVSFFASHIHKSIIINVFLVITITSH